jgi:hypothetical protein
MSTTARLRKQSAAGASDVAADAEPYHSDKTKKGDRGSSAAVTAAAAAATEPWWQRDWVVALGLLVVGLYTRLWDIADPRTQVFDETHFTKFSTWYDLQRLCTGIQPVAMCGA